MSRTQELALIIGAVAALAAPILVFASSVLVPVINARLARDAAQKVTVEQGQAVGVDATEAWRGRALRAESDLDKANHRIAHLEHRLATIEAQTSHD